jgi:hypothetical protein
MVMALAAGDAKAAGPGTLKAYFYYPEQIDSMPAKLKPFCEKPQRGQLEGVSTIAVDVAVALAGKVVESLVDAVAARTQAEVTTLETLLPIEGFFDAKGGHALDGGCLLLHNGSAEDASGASMLLSLGVVSANDRTAFRFDVRKWTFDRFLKPESSRWFQSEELRDFAIKVEFLSPGSAGVGSRAVFVEHAFAAMTVAQLKDAFATNQRLPWFAAPQKPSLPEGASGKYGPLNIKINVVETTKPNQFAVWTQEIARDKKADLSTLVKDAVRRSLDPTAAATEQARLADSAATAYAAYKAAWDDATAHKATRPKPGDANADANTKAWQALMTVKIQNVAAKQTLARAAFQAADLSWPGELPALSGS